MTDFSCITSSAFTLLCLCQSKQPILRINAGFKIKRRRQTTPSGIMPQSDLVLLQSHAHLHTHPRTQTHTHTRGFTKAQARLG